LDIYLKDKQDNIKVRIFLNFLDKPKAVFLTPDQLYEPNKLYHQVDYAFYHRIVQNLNKIMEWLKKMQKSSLKEAENLMVVFVWDV